MHAAVRSSLMAGVALVGSSIVAVSPVAPPPSEIRVPEIQVGSWEVRLAAASSLLNVPINLVTDLINIPYNEVQAVNELSSSLFFSGPWFVPSATNLWGIDPGDPGHFMATIDLLVPFPALSGLGLGELNPNGLGQQMWQLSAAELPVNAYCAASGCPPDVPMSPITGFTSVDYLLWDVASVTGLLTIPLVRNWFKVSFSQLMSGYSFGPSSPDYADPSGPANPGFGFLGTTEVTGPNGQPEFLMPWANTTFTLNLSQPFQNFFNSLMADPSTNPIQLPTLTDIGRALQALLAASVVAFDPTTAGSPFCAGNCSFLPAALDYPGIVQSIANAWPGNTLIDEWLTAYNNGTANVPTAAQIATSVPILHQGLWDFGNSSPPPALITGFNLSTLAPFFHNLWTALGLNPPPLATPTPATAPAPSTAAAVPAPATGPAPSIAAPTQQPLQGDVKPASTPQGSHQVGQGLDNAQPAIPKGTHSTTTSTSPGQVGGKVTPRGGSAGAPNATLDQSRSSRSANPSNANPSNASNGASTSVKPVHSGKK